MDSILIPYPHQKWDRHCQDSRIRFATTTADDPEFDMVLALREQVSDKPQAPDRIDLHSAHHLAFVNDEPAATLRVTRLTDGELDCGNYYPNTILNEFRAELCNASRFFAHSKHPHSLKLAHLLVEVAWRQQLQLGTRLDVINVHERAIRYYGRMGYELVSNSFFRHPVLDTPSRVMVFPATPCRDTPLDHVFDDIESPFDFETLATLVDLEPWREFRKSQ